MIRKRIIFLCAFIPAIGLASALLVASATSPTASVSGMVVDEVGMPVAGATVRIQATDNSTLSASNGHFTLAGLTEGVTVTVSAWKGGYYCAKVEGVVPPTNNITLTLRLYQTNDNPQYEWIAPAGANSCYSCKPGVAQIWLDNDAHGKSGINPRFLSLYNGTDISGTITIAPGYKLDFPGTAGNCATCHAPGAAVDAPFTTDMDLLSGVDRDFGVHCDFCHKVADIYLNPATGLPYANAPGVLSMDVRRPFPDSERYQLFFGTFDDDNVPEEDTYLPLIEKSQWCAPCHQFSYWGTPIYQSFKEWLESPYPAMGVECQTCHMPPDGKMTNVAPGFGGVERDSFTIHAHVMPGASSVELLQDTVTLTLEVEQIGNRIQVNAKIFNYGAGHHVPTDHPGRHMILLVAATNERGQELPLLSGPIVPAWGEAQAGLPGKLYAKVLRNAVSGEYPVVSYWKPSFIVSDNRIPALEGDQSQYIFVAPAVGEQVTVTAQVGFRRLFSAEAERRGWNIPDILMEESSLEVVVLPWTTVYIPLIQR